MKDLRYISLLTITGVLASCSTVDNTAKPVVHSVFPSFTVFGSENSLPSSTANNLSSQIEKLKPDEDLTLREFLSKLGLKNYKQNLSVNMRWNHYFVYIDENRVLYIQVDVEKLNNTLGMFEPDLNVPVISCSIRENPNLTTIQWERQTKMQNKSQ